jgi:hypothetical protein
VRTSTVYLLHFEPAYSAPIGDTGRVKIAGHYVGSCAVPVDERVAEHVAGRGSPLVRAAVAAGCEVLLAATWPGDRKAERHYKRGHRHNRRCPICRPELEGRHRG